MKRLVIDTSALLAFLEDGTGADKVEELLWNATAKQQPITMSVASWGLLYKQILHKYGERLASEKFGQLQNLPLKLVEVDSPIAQNAALLSEKHKLPYLESLAVATAQLNKATLVTVNGALSALDAELKVSVVG
jgi:PIN domain nuclease of toxin-antitoxin system